MAEEGDDEGGAVVAVDGGDDVSIARERNGAREGGGGDLRGAEIDGTGRSRQSGRVATFSHSFS